MPRPIWTFDRRRRARVGVRSGVRVDLPGQDLTLQVREISSGGLIVSAAQALTPGSRFELTLCLDGQGTWTVSVRVAHCRSLLSLDAHNRARFETGLAFEALPADVAAAIEALVSRLASPASPARARE